MVTTPTAPALLEAWERGRAFSVPWRGVALLSVILPGISPETLAALRPGERDRHLLALRTRAFGPRAELVADCPACGTRVQFQGTLTPPETAGVVAPEGTVEVLEDGYRVTVGPLTVADLSNAVATGEPGAARRLLLERSVIDAEGEGGKVSADALPETVVAAVEAALVAMDPPAVPEINLTCPDCATRWAAVLDVAALLWEEVEVWARRILGEVDALARAYGWREVDILALTPWRRRAYLDMAGAG